MLTNYFGYRVHSIATKQEIQPAQSLIALSFPDLLPVEILSVNVCSMYTVSQKKTPPSRYFLYNSVKNEPI